MRRNVDCYGFVRRTDELLSVLESRFDHRSSIVTKDFSIIERHKQHYHNNTITMGKTTNKGGPSKPKKGQPPPVDKLIKPAIGIGLAMLVYQFIKGLNSEVSVDEQSKP